ncbi:LacI family DNA-binding transcriptional regulator [uncultured Maribacter sp.]|uniref:LacI family DNA-binding transcriptional regulator n=1 Tax=uncultured Maribacter sp. TaxID=431308 RepID=UPI00262EC15D|nr:LacI family DNA-binding transcriptional regulator [uncultured Maribacter sp.]
MENNLITIHDIAKALGIDSSTVSRALNNSNRVSLKTKKKIIDKANELGYQRNLLASNLRRNKTNTIGVIVPRISRYFFSSAISGIEKTAFEKGYNVIICQSLEQLEREENLINTLAANRVDGIIMSVSMETLNYNHLDGLKKNGTPIVIFDRHCDIPDRNNVLLDDFAGAFEATNHLIEEGCINIVHFSGPKNLNVYRNRLKGYKAALEKHEIPFRENLVLNSHLMQEDGITLAEKVLRLPESIDGIFSANDVAAIGAMQYLKQKGINIPKDIAMVGFSNGPTSAVMDPPLSTIDQSGGKMGELSANLLFEQLQIKPLERESKTIIVKPSLLIRESSKKKKK